MKPIESKKRSPRALSFIRSNYETVKFSLYYEERAVVTAQEKVDLGKRKLKFVTRNFSLYR